MKFPSRFLCLCALFFWTAGAFALDPGAAKLTVTFLDCGQGDAAVVESPGGKTYLIDAGTNDKFFGGDFDAGEAALLPFLNRKRIENLDGLLLSHPHLDHYGGFFVVLASRPAGAFYDSGWPSVSPIYLKLLKKIDAQKIRYFAPKRGEPLDWDPALHVLVLNPEAEVRLGKKKQREINDHSLVLQLTYGKVSFLFTGDIESGAEAELAGRFKEALASTVLKVAHHGSRTSSSSLFLRKVKPRVAVISCGRRNHYGHPHAEALKRLKGTGAKIYRTDQDGTVEIVSDGKDFEVRTHPPAAQRP